jgi:hypothetical protein
VFPVAVGLLAGLTGCRVQSDNRVERFTTYPVKGQVLLADGKPLSGGMIHFVSPDNLSRMANGQIGPDGRFSLVTGSSGEGAAPGKYKVWVEPEGAFTAAAKSEGKKGTAARRKAAFPVKYMDEDSSGLVITLQAQPTELDPILLK